jgi:hypothetical protein
MNIPPLNKLADLIGEYAREVLVSTKSDLPASWIIVDADGKSSAFSTPWRDDREKRMYAMMMGRMMRRKNAKAYALVVEAWAAKAREGWEEGQPHVEPRNDPNRREVVVAFATDGLDIAWRVWDLVRDAEGKCASLDLQTKDPMQLESWLTELLN